MVGIWLRNKATLFIYTFGGCAYGCLLGYIDSWNLLRLDSLHRNAGNPSEASLRLSAGGLEKTGIANT